MDRTECESCGSRGEELVVVRRLYVTPASWDADGSVQRASLESWCFVCRTHYPHLELDQAGEPLTEHELSWPEQSPPPSPA